jgi:type II secretory pathway pseudopilin PulG
MLTGKVTGAAQSGFSYIGILLFIAISGIALAATGQMWSTEIKRQREKELLFVGAQYAHAIQSYYEATPNGVRQYPKDLQDLLLDARFPVVKRHLRKLYNDPVTGKQDWGLIKVQGRVVGVHSLSMANPVRSTGFPKSLVIRESDMPLTYADWQFVLATQSLDGQEDAGDAGNAVASTSAARTPTEASNSEESSPNNQSGAQDDFLKKQACLSQRVSDTAACSFYCKAKGADTVECRECQSSVMTRNSACLKGETQPSIADG